MFTGDLGAELGAIEPQSMWAILLVHMRQKLLLIFTTLVLFATACGTTTDDEIFDESGREQLLQEILAEPELGISRDLAECFIDYVVDNSPLDFEQWNTLGDDYPVSTEALEAYQKKKWKT